jgi:hypothetical protein
MPESLPGSQADAPDAPRLKQREAEIRALAKNQ